MTTGKWPSNKPLTRALLADRYSSLNMSLTAGAITALTALTKPLPDAPTVQVLGLFRYLVDPTFRPATALALLPFVHHFYRITPLIITIGYTGAQQMYMTL